MSDLYINNLYADGAAVLEENTYKTLLHEYERVVVQSLITSFGLDLLIRDQHGGDVDTVHNVRLIGTDPEMYYKNLDNQQAYQNRTNYDNGKYHSNASFRAAKNTTRDRWRETGVDIKDTYTGKQIGFHGHTKAIPPERKAELDHIVECEGIHNDRGRVLSGLDGIQLANQPENFAWTNESLNKSMGSWAHQTNERYKKEHNGMDAPLSEIDALAYIKAHPELDEETKMRLTEQYERARKAYDSHIEREYYSSKAFMRDTAAAAAKTGLKMGLRQAVGFVFAEIWFSVRDELAKEGHNSKAKLESIGRGIKEGADRALEKYHEVLQHFLNGTLSGLLASLTTTLCNIFFTTAKRLIRIIRQSWASLVEAINTILFNPECLPFGERIRAAIKLIATGASIVAGQLLTELLSETAIGKIPVIGDAITTFCGALITGILSCTFLHFLDHNGGIARIIETLNKIPTVEDSVIYYQRMAVLLDFYSAKLFSIDINVFLEQADRFDRLLVLIDGKSEEEVNQIMHVVYQKWNLDFPYGDLEMDMTIPGHVLSFS